MELERQRITMQAPTVEDNGDLVFEAIAVDKNTEPNRAGFVFDWDSPSDVDVSAWRQNPVVEYMHDDWRIPIGMVEQIQVSDADVRVRVRIPDLSDSEGMEAFDSAELAPVRGAIREGLLRAVSIGFYPKETERVEEDGREFYRVKKLEIIEVSVVTIGAHETALIQQSDLVDGGEELAQYWQSGEFEQQDVDAGQLYRLSLPERQTQAAEDTEDAGGDTEGNTEDPPEPETPEEQQDEQWQAIPFDRDGHAGQSTADKDMEWNGSDQTAAAEVEGLQIMALFEDQENLENKTAYKGPHHDADSHDVVWRGVAAAMAALNGARGGFEGIPDDEMRDGYDHLAEHYDQFDEEPPEFQAGGYGKVALDALHQAGRIIIPGRELPDETEQSRDTDPESPPAGESPPEEPDGEDAAPSEDQLREAARSILKADEDFSAMRQALVNAVIQARRERNDRRE